MRWADIGARVSVVHLGLHSDDLQRVAVDRQVRPHTRRIFHRVVGSKAVAALRSSLACTLMIVCFPKLLCVTAPRISPVGTVDHFEVGRSTSKDVMRKDGDPLPQHAARHAARSAERLLRFSTRLPRPVTASPGYPMRAPWTSGSNAVLSSAQWTRNARDAVDAAWKRAILLVSAIASSCWILFCHLCNSHSVFRKPHLTIYKLTSCDPGLHDTYAEARSRGTEPSLRRVSWRTFPMDQMILGHSAPVTTRPAVLVCGGRDGSKTITVMPLRGFAGGLWLTKTAD